MLGRLYRNLVVATISLGLAATSFGAVTVRLETSATPPGGIVAMGIYLDIDVDTPTVIVAPLAFDTTRVNAIAIVAGSDDIGSVIDYAPSPEGVTLLVYHVTEALAAGHLATLYLEVAIDAPEDTSIAITDGGLSASNRDADRLPATLTTTPMEFTALRTPHRADTDGNGRINLSEVLRVVQLYGLGEFRCDGTQEDGIAPGSSPQDCVPHDLDYAPQDWRFNLSELLRCVQFFNAFKGTYVPKEGTEDGFVSGLDG